MLKELDNEKVIKMVHSLTQKKNCHLFYTIDPKSDSQNYLLLSETDIGIKLYIEAVYKKYITEYIADLEKSIIDTNYHIKECRIWKNNYKYCAEMLITDISI